MLRVAAAITVKRYLCLYEGQLFSVAAENGGIKFRIIIAFCLYLKVAYACTFALPITCIWTFKAFTGFPQSILVKMRLDLSVAKL